MKHYLDREGNEVRWEGSAHSIGEHQYFCDHHPLTPLVPIAADDAPGTHRLRRHGGAVYYCPLCDADIAPSEPSKG